MSKLMLTLVAGCMSAALASAYAASGAPDASDKAGRMGPGTAAGQSGAVDPSPKGGATGAQGAARSATGAGATTSPGGAGAATSPGGMDDTKGRAPRAPRAEKG